MLIFPLKKQWYEKIKSGEKTIEYREVKPYWTRRLSHPDYCGEKELAALLTGKWISINFLNNSTKCKLRLGYTNKYMTAYISKIEVVDGKDTDLAIDKPVYAIHLSDVKEIK